MTKPTTKTVALFIALLASAAFLLYSLTATGPPRGEDAGEAGDKQAASTSESSLLAPAAPADADLGRYGTIIARNVFAPYKPPVAKPDKSALPPLTLNSVKSTPAKPATPASPRVDLAGWSYVGYMTIDGVRYGLLESESTRSWEQLKEGDSFQGATVQKIDATEIRFGSGSTHLALTRDERFPLLPLESTGTAGTSGGPSPPRPPRRGGSSP